MPAKIHIVKGRSAASRLERLVREFGKACSEFKSALFIVPTRRLAEKIRESLGDCLAPQIYDIQAFADELIRVHEPLLLPNCEADRGLLLDQVVAELRNDALPYFAPVTETRGFSQAAAGFILELKEGGADVRRLLKTPPTEPEQETSYDQATRILERYERRLARCHRLDPGDRLGRAASLWEQSRRAPFDSVRSVFVGGFTSIGGAQKRLVMAVRDSVEQFWIELPDQVKEESTAEGSENEPGELVDDGRSLPIETVSTPPAESVPARLNEAAGVLGEARWIARHVRQALAGGVRPERVLVVARRFDTGSIALFQEVFDEYEIPHDAEGAARLGDSPLVAYLLRTWRVPDLGWEFSQVASILRSTFFRPDWPEVRDDPEIAARAEALLRMLDEIRGRDEFLRALDTWDQSPPEPLEDEQPEAPLRLRKQRLAKRCRPFLERFFRLWDNPGRNGTAAEAVARLKTFSDEIGLCRAHPPDLSDLARFWSELERWATRATSGGRKRLRPERFARVLETLASAPGRARSIRGGGVALLSAENAVGMDCDYLCLVGLGEGSWPNLNSPESLLDDRERRRLRQSGLALASPETRLERERRLFDALIAAPRRELVLSYAAVDDKGQKLLPCSFLREYLENSPAPIVSRQRMPLDGYFEREPMSAVELRTQMAQRGKPAPPLSPPVVDNLVRASAVARARFESVHYTSFDGELRHPATVLELTRRVGRDRVFSPTALESYVACPFRFLLQHVLDLEPLEDPTEEVANARRGSAFHRALARFHERLKGEGTDRLERDDRHDSLTEELVQQVERAVGEYAARAPSRASAELWRLEGKRLERAARRYRAHWTAFRAPWLSHKAIPTPHRFEARFGATSPEGAQPLILTAGGIEVQIGGYIDRVDLIELEETTGFWVIDYKTGRAASYQASHVARFEKLQLPLYALAVERVLLKDRRARPLGLAYWLVTDNGAKPVLPSGRNRALAWLADPEAWAKFSRQLEEWVARIVKHMRAGDFPLAPRSETCTDTCSFGSICRINQSRRTGKVFALELPLIEGETPAE